MKHKIPGNLVSLLKLVLILGILSVGLQNILAYKVAISVSPAIAQTVSRPGSIIPSIPILPAAELYPQGQSGIISVPTNSPVDFGGGEYRLPNIPDMTEQQRREIQNEINRNIQRLGLSRSKDNAPFSTSLTWPIKAAVGLTDYGYHGVSAFVDHNDAYPHHLLD